VHENLAQWQEKGLVPDMPIEPGDKTDEPIRTRGWTHWHQLFGARQLLVSANLNRYVHSRAEVPQADGEGPLIIGGVLQIEWPTLIETDEPAPLDLLLATATHPTLVGDPPQYPDPGTIAKAWRDDTSGHASYFRNNRRDGIHTFEDDAISGLL